MSHSTTTLPLRARRGARAERIVMRHLEAMGWTVLARNLRVGYLEIDIVARDGPTIAIVEVRCRGSGAWLRPLDTVDSVKRARLRRAAALLWSRKWRRLPGVERVRFDVAGVDLDGGDALRVEYVRAAF